MHGSAHSGEAPPVEEILVDLGEVTLFVRRMGRRRPDRPTLVVLHGGPDVGHSYLLPGLTPLAVDHDVVLFDFRGCGRSSRDLPPDALQPELVVEDTHRAIERDAGGALRNSTIFVWDLELAPAYLELIDGLDEGDWSYERYLDGRMHPWVVGDAEQILRDCGKPIMILHGEKDMGFPVQLARRLHAAVPRSALAVIPDAAHLCHFEKPDLWSGHLRAFLDGGAS